jgi:(p)ppGpp synthase/HD superfamily hydrolase
MKDLEEEKIRRLVMDSAIEKAITFLVTADSTSGHNPKPVIVHSIRVGFYLFKKEYSEPIVLAGILHDILEDTKVTGKDLEKAFGEQVTKLVKANSFNVGIKDYQERYQNVFERCRSTGKEAIIVKAADILDNAIFFLVAEEQLIKVKTFLTIAKNMINEEIVFKELQKRYLIIKD